jgi:hypothetical protein
MSAAPAIWTENAAIDRWVAPAYEPQAVCRTCGHEPEFHDEHGCTAFSNEEGAPELCCCERFV